MPPYFSYTVISEIMSKSFMYPILLKSIDLVFTLMNLLNFKLFQKYYLVVIRKILVQWTIQTDLPNVGMFLYTIKKKNHILKCCYKWHQKSLWMLGSCQTRGGGFQFFKILIFTWKLNFLCWHLLSVVYCHWQENVYPSQFGVVCPSVLLLSCKSGVLWK